MTGRSEPMRIELEIDGELAARVHAEAARTGRSVADVLIDAADRALPPKPRCRSAFVVKTFDLELREWADPDRLNRFGG